MRSTESIAVMIPVRLNSTRLPNKAILDLNGKPVIQRVYENALKSTAHLKNIDVYVCTDSKEIQAIIQNISGQVLMTSSNPRNGTERIAEAFKTYNLNYNYIIDVQGDEPFVTQEIISLVVDNLCAEGSKAEKIVLPHEEMNLEEADSNSVVKVVTNSAGKVLYMSRSLIPACKGNTPHNEYKRHLSVIGFTGLALKKYVDLDIGSSELYEDIELLRALEGEIAIYSPKSSTKSFSIDTRDDLERARKLLQEA